jgi:hypothetical protein
MAVNAFKGIVNIKTLFPGQYLEFKPQHQPQYLIVYGMK